MDMYLSVPFCFWHLLIYLFAFTPPNKKPFFRIESIFFLFHLHRNAKNLLYPCISSIANQTLMSFDMCMPLGLTVKYLNLALFTQFCQFQAILSSRLADCVQTTLNISEVWLFSLSGSVNIRQKLFWCHLIRFHMSTINKRNGVQES